MMNIWLHSDLSPVISLVFTPVCSAPVGAEADGALPRGAISDCSFEPLQNWWPHSPPDALVLARPLTSNTFNYRVLLQQQATVLPLRALTKASKTGAKVCALRMKPLNTKPGMHK